MSGPQILHDSDDSSAGNRSLFYPDALATHRPALAGRRIDRAAQFGIPGLIRSVSEVRARAIALVDQDRSISYKALDRLSDQLAVDLAGTAGPGEEPVAIQLTRGVDMVVAMLAVLKVGRPYLPVDVYEPASRLARIMDAAGPVAVISSVAGPRRSYVLGSLPQLTVPRSTSRPRPLQLPVIAPDSASYVMFTSGSTGVPKGVVQGTAGLCNRLLWMRDSFAVTVGDRILQKAPYTFDVSGWEVWLPLISGGRCILMPADAQYDPDLICRWIDEHAITMCHFVPSMLHEFLRQLPDRSCSSLRHVVCSGEVFAPRLAARAVGRLTPARLHNLYGPTEAAIDVTSWTIPAGFVDNRNVPIGTPIDNVDLYVLDGVGRPVREGSEGELWIGGIAVANGYAGNPDATRRAFRVNKRGRMYRTGDRVRLVDKVLVYRGRVDDQIKVRGTRIEPAEIERALEGHGAVGQAVACAVMRSGSDPPVLAAALSLAVPAGRCPGDNELRDFLAQRLPRAYVPSVFCWLARIPLGRAGKVDRVAVGRAIELTLGVAEEDEQSDPVGWAWSAVLATTDAGDGEEIGFVSAGGHSLAAARLVGLLSERCRVRIPLSVLLRDNASLAQLRDIVAVAPRRSEAAGAQQNVAKPREGMPELATTPLPPQLSRLWALGKLYPLSAAAYNVVAAVRIDGRLKTSTLRRALNHVAQRRDVLRLSVQDTPGGPRLTVPAQLAMGVRLDVVDTADELDDNDVRDFIQACAARTIPPEAPMIRAHLLTHRPSAGHCLVLVLSHMIADQRTADILIADLARAYTATSNGIPESDEIALPAYARYGVASLRSVGGEHWRRDLEYWRGKLSGVPDELRMPRRRSRPAEPSYRGHTATRSLSPALSAGIDSMIRSLGITPAAFFLAAFGVILRAWTGQDVVVIGIPSDARRAPEEQHLAGLLVDTLALRLDMGGMSTFREIMQQARDGYVEAAEHATATFDAVVAELGVRPTPSRNPVFQAWFNDLSRVADQQEWPGARLRQVTAPTSIALFDVGAYLRRESGSYLLDLVVAADLFEAAVAKELADQVLLVIDQVLPDGDSELDSLDLVTRRFRHLTGFKSGAQMAAGERIPHAATARSPASVVSKRVRAVAVAADVDGILLDPASGGERPDSVAIVGPDGGLLTYETLRAAVERAAAELRGAEIKPGAVVELRARRSMLLPVALLALWRVGAVVMLTDAGHPAELLRNCRGVVRPSHAVELADDTRLRVSRLPAEPAGSAVLPEAIGYAPEGSSVRPSHVLFTSGTSGSPIAVQVGRAPIANFLGWYIKTFRIGAEDRFALLSGLGHDPILRDMLVPLLGGGCLYVPPPGLTRNPEKLLRWIDQHGITVVHATPGLLELLAAAHSACGVQLPSLRLVVCGGDLLTAGLVRRVQRICKARIVNAYGTTETPQVASCHVVAEAGVPVPEDLRDSTEMPVGRGAARTQVLVLMPSGLQAGAFQRGEVVVRGLDLADCYLGGGRSEGAFGADPLGYPAMRLYHTGDFGYHLPDGSVVITGRRDHQVSINGHRLELAEVEAVARDFPGVRSARASVAETLAGPMLRLAVTAEDTSPSVAGLLARLRECVPAHAVPATVTLVDGLELDRNHKVLPSESGAAELAIGTTTPVPVASADVRDLIDQLGELVARVMGTRVGPNENFFDAGLSSLALLQLHGVISAELAVSLPATALFAHPNIRSLAESLCARQGVSAAVAQPSKQTARFQETGNLRRHIRARMRSESEGLR